MTRTATLALGAAATLAVVAIDASPLGGNRHIADQIEAFARQQLDQDEMATVTARVADGPLRRRLLLAGPGDDFQRAEIVRRMEALPGVSEARWNKRHGPFPLPMMIEAALMALAAYAAGATLSYLLKLRRRARSLDRY